MKKLEFKIIIEYDNTESCLQSLDELHEELEGIISDWMDEHDRDKYNHILSHNVRVIEFK